MGLDFIELIMATEEEFGISFRETETYGADTVGKLVDVIHCRLRKEEKAFCPSQHVFYKIRKNLMQNYGIFRPQIKPDSQFEMLIPRKNRRKVWEKFLMDLSGISARDIPLELADRIKWSVTFFLPAVVFLASFTYLPLSLWWIGLLTAWFTVLFFDWILTPIKKEFPRNCVATKELVKYIKSADIKVWSRNQVFEKIKKIIVEQRDITPEHITLNAHWVDDLGMG